MLNSTHEPVTISSDDNLLVITAAADFDKGTHDGTVSQSADGNGTVGLKDGAAQGVYTSPEIKTKPFEYLILSWNANTPEGAYIEIEGRVHAGAPGAQKTWSSWLSWGNWSSTAFKVEDGTTALAGSAHSTKADDTLACVDTDELYVKGSAGETADSYQFRLILHRASESGASPEVTLVAGTIRNSLKDQTVAMVIPEGAPDLSKLEKDLDVPTYSQYMRHTKISSSICSPTSVAMALGYFGIDVSPEEAAWGVNDYVGDMFGNWPFNTAYAAAHGITSYVRYGTVAEGIDPWYVVKQEIDAGNPVIVSVRYRKPGYAGSNEPAVEGVPIDSTPGHLVLVRGFTWKDGKEYVIVNDPAARADDQVRREYLADQFNRAWGKKVMYVLHADEAEAAVASIAPEIAGELVRVGDAVNGSQKFELKVNGAAVNLNSTSVRSIVVSFNGEKTTPVNPREAVLQESNYLWFKADSPAGTYKFWVFGLNKEVYTAEMQWN